jgi:hypothetical protein
VLFRRVDNASLGRENDSMRILKESLPVIWIGLCGIGKSSASSVMLVKAIQQMIDFHENGPSTTNFQQVLYRVREDLSEIDVEYVTPKSFRVRRNIHVLVVGDPGLGKSQMLRAAASIAPRAIFVTGNTSTAAGLTVTVTRDSGSRQGGELCIEAGARTSR